MKESRILEYKREISHTYLKTVSAYANYGTGEIKFGIDDKGQTIGIENLEESCLRIENQINDQINPKPDFTLDINRRTSVITLKIKEGLHKPYFYKSKAYRRNDSATVEVDTLELTRLILEGQNMTFENLKSSKQDLSFNYLEEALKATLGIQVLSKDIQRTLEIYSDNAGYNNAAALLADENIFPGIDIVKFGENINVLQNRKTIEHVSILKQFEKAMEMYRQYYQYEEIKDAYRVIIETIPEVAFREAIANAIIHRVWDVGAHIRVAMYIDKIEITSPGGLPKDITEDEYLEGQVSILRNPIIGSVFFRLNHIERFGTGVRRIINAYVDSEINPQFGVFENSIKVTLPVLQLKSLLNSDEKLILEALAGYKKMSSSEIASFTGFGKTKVVSLLNALVQQGLIKAEGSGRGRKYTR
ncbi:MAG: ATP-binding protein [Eubacteriales bacterium]|nr:ATP-binding protein [Eubacteriales bacterium]MDD4323539.1 ATP-binding protein [Eubacteriales bacterium]MDD4541633.1 ATP-binding protein [Eubacteriales bacterium]